jgi:outer membrane protein assembly factor BamB
MYDAQHTGRSPFVGPTNPVIKWAVDTGNPSSAPFYGRVGSPAIGLDGTLYFTSGSQGSGEFLALNPDGSLKCDLNLNAYGTPAIALDGTIYIGVAALPDDLLYALNPNCTVKWTIALPNPTSLQPHHPIVGPDGTIYVGLGNGPGSSNLFAVNAGGTMKWIIPTSGNIESTPAFLSNGSVVLSSAYLGGGGGTLQVLNPTDGSQVCSFPLPQSVVDNNPTIAPDDTIYIGYGASSFKAVNPNCTELWTFNLPADHIVKTVALSADGTIYAATGDTSDHGFLFAVNPNGTESCHLALEDQAEGEQIVDAAGTIYVHVGDQLEAAPVKHLYAINPNCTVKWSIATGGGNLSPPAMGADGTIYAASADGKLYAIGNASGTSTLKGDVNSDGVVNIIDARICLQKALGFIAIHPPDPCDVNGDGQVTLEDAQLIAQYAIGQISSFAALGAPALALSVLLVSLIKRRTIRKWFGRRIFFVLPLLLAVGVLLTSCVSTSPALFFSGNGLSSDPATRYGPTQITLVASNMPDGGLAAISVANGGMTFDPHRVQINSITGVNGFTVLASVIDNGAGKVSFAAVNPANGVTQGPIVRFNITITGAGGSPSIEQTTMIQIDPSKVVLGDANNVLIPTGSVGIPAAEFRIFAGP